MGTLSFKSADVVKSPALDGNLGDNVSGVNGSDFSPELFENEVTSTLVALYERSPKRKSGPRRMLERDFLSMRRFGTYVPHPSRLFEQTTELPFSVQPSCRAALSVALSKSDCYRCLFLLRPLNGLPKGFISHGHKQMYELLTTVAYNDGRSGGWRDVITISQNGRVRACDAREPVGRGRSILWGEASKHVGWDNLTYAAYMASLVIQANDDRRHCWSINATEHDASVSIGVTAEEIKSVLYARSLPVTATGRKRPILHYVQAHTRRIRSGIDVDVREFMRGTSVVEMHGGVFEINPPATLLQRIADAKATK